MCLNTQKRARDTSGNIAQTAASRQPQALGPDERRGWVPVARPLPVAAHTTGNFMGNATSEPDWEPLAGASATGRNRNHRGFNPMVTAFSAALEATWALNAASTLADEAKDVESESGHQDVPVESEHPPTLSQQHLSVTEAGMHSPSHTVTPVSQSVAAIAANASASGLVALSCSEPVATTPSRSGVAAITGILVTMPTAAQSSAEAPVAQALAAGVPPNCQWNCKLSTLTRIEKPYGCLLCDYRCSVKSHLVVHERVHSGEKPFACSMCEYRCSTKSSLVVHERVHSGEKPYACSLCEYRSSQKAGLVRHELVHRGEKP